MDMDIMDISNGDTYVIYLKKVILIGLIAQVEDLFFRGGGGGGASESNPGDKK